MSNLEKEILYRENNVLKEENSINSNNELNIININSSFVKPGLRPLGINKTGGVNKKIFILISEESCL